MTASTYQRADNFSWEESTLHQLSPYVGKIKPNKVRDLILTYTEPYDTILDPFSGSGTVTLESLTLNRNAIANDINPYAVTLTKAKMYPPASMDEGGCPTIIYESIEYT
ncbi:MAG TPA: DNA methyltransferase [Desulfobacteria bacterium]|nr:DNA methyltransferase [Desulfobacteria bacterium]